MATINWQVTPAQRDRIVAEKLFGWQPVPCDEELTIYDDGTAFCYGCKQRDHISTFEHDVIAHPAYTQSMDAAWQVAIGHKVIDLLRLDTHRYRVRLSPDTALSAYADTAPEAICIAALRAAGFEVKQ